MDWKNMDLSDLNDIEIDIHNMGSWPTLGKVMFAGVIVLLTFILSYFTVIKDSSEQYEKSVAYEEQLKFQYQTKYQIALNADAYQLQMEQMEQDFAELLKKLPTVSETPGLLDDITYIGTTSGLAFNKINWQAKVEREFYTELPLQLEVVGDYHQFGEFLSLVAGLPRIVTLHDFTIVPETKTKLRLNLIAKTYRYKEVK